MKIFVFLLLLFFSCGPDVPEFDENRAFGHLLTQCDFGPRNPGLIEFLANGPGEMLT